MPLKPPSPYLSFFVCLYNQTFPRAKKAPPKQGPKQGPIKIPPNIVKLGSITIARGEC